MIIKSPLGSDFKIPDEPPARREASLKCVQGVWGGEYDDPSLHGLHVETVIDVGCNIGSFSILAASWWGTGIKLSCYDPNVDALALCEENLLAANVEFLSHAVAVTAGKNPRLFMNVDWGQCHTWGAPRGDVVPSIHPADLPLADVLKVDGEGIEVEVVSSWEGLTTVKAVLLEFHRLEHRIEIDRICASAGLTRRRYTPVPDQLHLGEEASQGTEIWTR